MMPPLTQTQRKILREKILKRAELYELNNSRFKRILKDPLRTLFYYILQAFGYLHPFRVRYTTLWGAPMSFYLPEGGMIYYYGFWEVNLVNFLTRFLHEGEIFVDIGAHVGYYSILASDLVGSAGHVYSFEPTPRTFTSLKENTKKRTNTEVFNTAVLNTKTEIEFYDYGPKYSAFNTFKKRTDSAIFFKDEATKIQVATVSLDIFCKEKNIQPTMIKIDAEGSEYLILESMSAILTTTLPIVSIEVSNFEEWKHNLSKSLAILEKHNYTAYQMTKEGKLSQCNPAMHREYDNLIFIHPERKHKLITTNQADFE